MQGDNKGAVLAFSSTHYCNAMHNYNDFYSFGNWKTIAMPELFRAFPRQVGVFVVVTVC